MAALDAFEVGMRDNLHPDDRGGKKGRSFGKGLAGVDPSKLPDRQLTRSEVFELAANRSVETETVCAGIMAWGGMNQRFSKRFFSAADAGWLCVADGIREGEVDRRAAYESLRALRDKGGLYGVGPAYFTKLIYFLMPRPSRSRNPAYIMDQWAGCSINLLLSKELVKMDVMRQWRKGAEEPVSTYRVSDANTADDYDRFCTSAETLRAHFNLKHDQVDCFMVARGGRDKSNWRRHVIENRST